KAASATPQTRRLYRYLGNRLGDREHSQRGRPKHARFLMDALKNKVNPGDRVLDIGTGWMTFYSVCLTSAMKVKATAFDVIDNRQFGATQQYFANRPELPGADAVRQSRSFDELHETLGIDYLLAPSLESLPDNHYQAAFSIATLEHVPRSVIREQIIDTFRVLKPGGYAVHRIDLTDHLSHYDKSAHPRQFLSWDASWPILFRNEVQYVNRLMRSDFLEMFTDAGFTIEHQESNIAPLNGMRVAEHFRHRSRDDLESKSLVVICGKPTEEKP
ncbi:MAG TPA: class I SAM-dependent methyltransferase, partial [Rhodothermales bacterium]|nr:class I SAM-dependent methyltransferase [Rhodothermales bacterium]